MSVALYIITAVSEECAAVQLSAQAHISFLCTWEKAARSFVQPTMLQHRAIIFLLTLFPSGVPKAMKLLQVHSTQLVAPVRVARNLDPPKVLDLLLLRIYVMLHVVLWIDQVRAYVQQLEVDGSRCNATDCLQSRYHGGLKSCGRASARQSVGRKPADDTKCETVDGIVVPSQVR